MKPYKRPRPDPSPEKMVCGSFDQASRDSWDCPHCGGTGMCVVFRKDHTSSGIANNFNGLPCATRVGAHCCCAAGVWMRERNKPEIQARIPRVQDVLDDPKSSWLLEEPGSDVPCNSPATKPSNSVSSTSGRAKRRNLATTTE